MSIVTQYFLPEGQLAIATPRLFFLSSGAGFVHSFRLLLSRLVPLDKLQSTNLGVYPFSSFVLCPYIRLSPFPNGFIVFTLRSIALLGIVESDQQSVAYWNEVRITAVSFNSNAARVELPLRRLS